MIMNVKARGVTRRMSRLVRWLTGRNALRRPVDRIEGAVLVALSTALVVAVAMAAVLGTHAYQSQRAASASLHPAVAVLIQAGPFYGSATHIGQAEARWRDRWGGKPIRRADHRVRARHPGCGGGYPDTGLAGSFRSAGRASRQPGRHGP